MARYEDLRFNSGEYIPQYAGVPLQQIQQTAEQLASRHYQNLAQASQLQILQNQLKSQALPGAKGYFDSHISGVQSALEDMAKNGGENSTARINALATAFQGDQGMLNAMQRSKEYAKQTELIDQMTAQGHQPLYDKARRDALANAQVGDDVYNAPYSSAVEQYMDPTPEREAIWKTLHADSIEGNIKAAIGTAPADLIGQAFAGENPNLPMFFEAITRAGISGTKVKAQLENAWSTYKNSKSYKQQTGNLVGKTEDQAKDEFLQQGLLRVYNEVKREYRPTPNWAGRAGDENSPPLITPMSSKTREGFDVGDLDPYSNLDKNVAKSQASMLRSRAVDLGDSEAAKKLVKRAEELEQVGTTTDTDILNKRIKWSRAAMSDAGIPSANMTDEQIAKWSKTPEGEKVLKGFTGKVGEPRFHAPMIENFKSKAEADATSELIKRGSQDREFIDLDTRQKIGRVKDEKGNTKDEAKEITKALSDGKFVVQGTLLPNHVLTDLGEDSESFARAIRASVTLEDGTVRDIAVSQLPETTSLQDINENVLYRQATDVPNMWSKLSNGVEVIKPSSATSKEELYNEWLKQGGSPEVVPKEAFMSSPNVVMLRENGILIPSENTTLAAKYISKSGVKLTRKK